MISLEIGPAGSNEATAARFSIELNWRAFASGSDEFAATRLAPVPVRAESPSRGSL
jgi:hypothetical protein